MTTAVSQNEFIDLKWKPKPESSASVVHQTTAGGHFLSTRNTFVPLVADGGISHKPLRVSRWDMDVKLMFPKTVSVI